MTAEGPPPLVAAVFDMDGLLVDSEPLWHLAETEVFGRYGVTLTPELCRSTKGMFVGEVARHWFARSPWSGATPGQVADEVVEAMAVLLGERATLLPGVQHALDFCRARVSGLALASSSPRRLIDIVLERFDLRRCFDAVRSAEAERAGKPDPAIFLSTAAALGCDPRRCVVFEDSPAGLAAARAAGMRCVAVPERRLGPAPDGFDAADVILRSLDELDAATWAMVAGRVASSPA